MSMPWVAHKHDYVDANGDTIYDYTDAIGCIHKDGILGSSLHPQVIVSATR